MKDPLAFEVETLELPDGRKLYLYSFTAEEADQGAGDDEPA